MDDGSKIKEGDGSGLGIISAHSACVGKQQLQESIEVCSTQGQKRPQVQQPLIKTEIKRGPNRGPGKARNRR